MNDTLEGMRGQRTRGTRVLSALALVAPLGGCDAMLGIEFLPRGTTDASVDSAPRANPACLGCEAAKCAAVRAACNREPSCDSLYRCLAVCDLGDIVCRAHCEQANDAAAKSTLFRSLDLCRREACPADCYGGSGFGAALSAPCACMDKLCAREMLACVTSGVATKTDVGACERRASCLAQQPNPDGFVQCASENGGATEFNALLDCMRTSDCVDSKTTLACTLGDGDIACTRNFVYGRSRAPDHAFTLGVQDFEGTPIADANVTACTPPVCDKGCAGVSGKTDKEGRVTLRIKMANGGFDGCIRVDPPIEYMPINVITGRRVHFDEDRLSTLALQEGLFALYARQAMVDLIPGRGHVILTIHDCLWGRVTGASLDDLGGGSTLAYIDGTAVKPEAKSTTATGAAAIVNLVPGPHELVVRKAGQVIARQSIVVHAGELTDANIYPLPK